MGTIKFTSDYGNHGFEDVFNAYKVTFKAGLEHKHIVDADAEMLIHHKTLKGNMAIASIFIKSDQYLENPNEFIDSLQTDLWNAEDGFEVTLPNHIDLDKIYRGGAKLYMDKSFFMYSGSKGVPPCDEGIYRFLFTEVIHVTPS